MKTITLQFISVNNLSILYLIFTQNQLTEKSMQYFISTFIIMLICIIALLQDKSYDSGVVLPRPQTKLSGPGSNRLLKCNKASHFVLKISPQLLAEKREIQAEVLTTFLTGRPIKLSNLNQTTELLTQRTPIVHTKTEKGISYINIFCSQCNLCLFSPTLSCYKQSFKELQD
jgi:hypothetical protein